MAEETATGPTVMVRVRRGEGGVLAADVREVAGAEAEAAAAAEGYIVVDVPASPFPPFPKWRYHPDGQRRIVQNQDEEDTLGGDWADSPTFDVVPNEPPSTEPPPVP